MVVKKDIPSEKHQEELVTLTEVNELLKEDKEPNFVKEFLRAIEVRRKLIKVSSFKPKK